MVTTNGTLLGGRVLFRQPAQGFRSGIEPVLLAASVPAQTGHRVLEVGVGAGAGLLCLANRVPGIQAVGVELDETISAIAAENMQRNGLTRIEIVVGDIESAPLEGRFDHVMANPPYHAPDGTVSPEPAREVAKRGSEALINAWIGRMSSVLRRRGNLILIVPSWLVQCCLTSMATLGSPCTDILPLWPKIDRPAKLVLLRGVKEGRSPMRLLPGLTLHRADGAFTDAAQAILTEAAALPWAG